jgi:hypothetical protein
VRRRDTDPSHLEAEEAVQQHHDELGGGTRSTRWARERGDVEHTENSSKAEAAKLKGCDALGIRSSFKED